MVETSEPAHGRSATPDDVLGFWFSAAIRPKWFRPDAGFDADVLHRFEGLYERAVQRGLDAWGSAAEGALALVIVLDQLPRNMYCGMPKAFAADPQALSAASVAIAQGLDRSLSDEQNVFLYMPFMHSERLEDQDRGIGLFERLGREENIDFMRRHRSVIARFGRFPHRNGILGRSSTPDESEFLADKAAWF